MISGTSESSSKWMIWEAATPASRSPTASAPAGHAGARPARNASDGQQQEHPADVSPLQRPHDEHGAAAGRRSQQERRRGDAADHAVTSTGRAAVARVRPPAISDSRLP